MKPILYLDVDGVLLCVNEELWRAAGCPTDPDKLLAAPGAHEFLMWAVEHFEVRWLSCWFMSGKHRPEKSRQLARPLGVSPELIESIAPRGWWHHKTEGIDWDDPRPFLWIEDGISATEMCGLEEHGRADSYVFCDTNADVTALQRLHEQLRATYERTV